jgi:group I intron endonuclease
MQVYLITHKESGKTYVGKTVMENLHGYLSVKRWQVNRKKVRGMPIISAILKYGWDAFDIQSVATCETKDELNGLERLWIAVLDSTNTGYNLCHGGEGPMGRSVSQETRDKIGAANRGKKRTTPAYARTEKHRQQLRDRMQGNKIGIGNANATRSLVTMSPEQRKARSKRATDVRWGRVFTC